MPWFDRQFQFAFEPDIYPSIVERLVGLLPRVRAKTDAPTSVDGIWITRFDGAWSAQENLGHIIDLEALWQGRLDDFEQGSAVLRPADLQNRKTHEAGHNQRPLDSIVRELEAARNATLDRVHALEPRDFARSSRHPRLDTPMRLIDHLYFVAEHDDHHLARISAILGRLP